ncbi:PspC domain-containing protein [Salinibacterium sp. ZJ450]|uniref:PspC domain-containing protein n=1 Tax=Salinibacterium sp. ZJ450 TaxID=2708338 RepID=UPI00141F63F5|nr:PspC domain-containing protein [Salinibacterium sp. ZJ450]
MPTESFPETPDAPQPGPQPQPPYFSQPPPAQPASNRFFAWLRNLDLTRQPGWIGGVAAGIAQRLNIDPLIVRGILVVVGLLGAPVLLLYAAAWMLLPDHTGKIHAEELSRGRFEAPVAGAGLMVLLELLPGANVALPFVGPIFPWWSVDGNFGDVLRVFWTLAVVGAAVWFAVWLSRRSSAQGSATSDPSGPTVVPATTDTDPATVPYGSEVFNSAASTVPFGSASPDAAGLVPPIATQPTVPLPNAGAAPTDAAELAAWKEQQERFKQERDQYVRDQRDAQRAATAARAAEQKRERDARAAAYREELDRTRSNPLYSLITIGVALVAGAGVMMLVGDGTLTNTAVVAGLATTLGVLGLAVIGNGVMGKRSGGASGMAWVVAAALIATSVLSIGGRIVFAGNPEFAPQYRDQTSVTYLVGAGQPVVDLSDYWDGAPRPAVRGNGHQYGSVTLLLGAGDTTVILPDDTAASLNLRSGVGDAELRQPDGSTDSGLQGFHQLLPAGADWDELAREISLTVMLGAGEITIITEGELR